MKKNVLVIGGAGYIGSHVCKALSTRGLSPVVFDNMEHGFERAVKWGPLVEGDILNTDLLEKTLRLYNPICVMHFAAYHDVRESAIVPEKYYSNNFSGTLSVLKAMIHCNVKYFIFSSSAAIYGLPEYTPIDENHPKNPINPYGRSKWIVEQMLTDFDHNNSLRFSSLRYFNAAGADVDGEIGEFLREGVSHLIPVTILAAKKRIPMTIFGDKHPTFDGTPIRDYVHVMDLAEAHILALEWLIKNDKSNQFNLGSESGFSVRQVISAVEKALGTNVPNKVGPANAYDPPILVANSSKARDVLGWNPKFSDLTTIIESSCKWMESQLALV